MSLATSENEWEAVLHFWFGKPDPQTHGEHDFNARLWWGGAAEVDDEVRCAFGNLTEEVAQVVATAPPSSSPWAGTRFAQWRENTFGCLALILLLDQFPRNIHRGSARAFTGDAAALSIARDIVARRVEWKRTQGDTLAAALSSAQRLFVVLCFEHSEDAADVREGISLIEELVAASASAASSRMRNQPNTFRQHLQLLEEFGRYPYRNAALGRASTEAEREFLGSRRVPTFARRTMKQQKEATKKPHAQLPHRMQLLQAAGVEVGGAYEGKFAESGSGIAAECRRSPAAAKVLMIHGFRGSAKSFNAKTGKLRSALAVAGFQTVYAEAPHEYRLAGQSLKEALEKFGGELPDLSHQRVWWMAEAEADDPHSTSEVADTPNREALLEKSYFYDGVEESLASLEADLELHGPISGILGFAQGATMAALLVERLARRQARNPTAWMGLKFAVFISGYSPRDDRYKAAFDGSPGGASPSCFSLKECEVATFHTWGEKDILIEPVRCLNLLAAFGGSYEGVQCASDDGTVVACPHPGAHFVPNMWPSSKIAEFARKFLPGEDGGGMLGKKEVVQRRVLALFAEQKFTGEQFESTANGPPLESMVTSLFEQLHVLREYLGMPLKGSDLERQAQLEELAVKPVDVSALVTALQNAASQKSKAFCPPQLQRSSSVGEVFLSPMRPHAQLDEATEDVFGADDVEIDVAGAGQLVSLLCDIAEEALWDEPLGFVGNKRVKSLLVSTPGMVSVSTRMEATHRNRYSEQMRVLDLGLFLWLQARRLDPTAKRVAGGAALMRLVDRDGCGWPGLTRLYELCTEGVTASATAVAGDWSRQALHADALAQDIVTLIGQTLKEDMQRCLPVEWIAYLVGTSYKAPGDAEEAVVHDHGGGTKQRRSRPDRATEASLAALLNIGQAGGPRWPSACALGVPSPGGAADRKTRISHAVAQICPGNYGRLRELLAILRSVLTHMSPRKLKALRDREQQDRAKTDRAMVLGPVIGTPAWEKQAAMPISDAVLNPEPEPVVPSTAAELEPLFEHLRTAAVPVANIARFTRGTLVPDGRLDLCKQVVGPDGIGPLCLALGAAYTKDGIGSNALAEVLAAPDPSGPTTAKPVGHSVTRLLLGNNICGNGGAKDIAELIRSGQSTITTWYIAGNRIDADGLRHVADALAEDKQVDMLWLKRNPLKLSGAQVIARLLQSNRLIHTLDLDNTGLLDEGAITVLDALAQNGGTLKHLYMNANGLGPKTADCIGELIGKKDCPLVQLMVGVNRFGDSGAKVIAAGLAANGSLSRLSMPSNRIGPVGAADFAEALKVNKTLLSLNLGFAKATGAVGELGNMVQDEGARLLAGALAVNCTLRELDVSQNGLFQKGVDYFLDVLRGSPAGGQAAAMAPTQSNTTLLTLSAASWGLTRNDIAQDELEALLLRNQKLCTQAELEMAAEAHMPKHVRDIYSVYRVE